MRVLLPVLIAVFACVPGSAQTEERNPLGSRPRIYVGGGLTPGVGAVAIGSEPVLDLFTREVVLYADYEPRVVGGAGRLLTAVGVGGGVRVSRFIDIVRNRDPGPFNLDVGIRMGPSFYTAFFTQTAESEARAFAIFLDPFARGTLRLGSNRVVFAEAGLQAPALRGGLSVSFQRGK